MNLFVLHLEHWVNIPKIAGQIPWRMLCSESGNQLLPVASCELRVDQVAAVRLGHWQESSWCWCWSWFAALWTYKKCRSSRAMPRSLLCRQMCKETDWESEQWHTKPNPSPSRSRSKLCAAINSKISCDAARHKSLTRQGRFEAPPTSALPSASSVSL